MRKKLFRIVISGEREKRLQHPHVRQRNVVRQLKVKFIVLDLKSHKSYFIFFFFLILHHYCFIYANVNIEMSRQREAESSTRERETRNEHENHFDLPLLIFKALFHIIQMSTVRRPNVIRSSLETLL